VKLCTVCGVVTSRAGCRCTDHARESNRSRHNARYSTREWQRLSARVLRAWRGEHGNWCPGPQARLGDDTWEAPVLAQGASIRLDEATIAAVVAALGSAERPVAIDRARLERRKRPLALDHAAGNLDDGTYLERVARLQAELATLDQAATGGVPAERAVTWLRALAETWERADVPEERADLLHDRRRPAHSGRLRARFGAGSAREG
jgi:hypothetical protein